MDQADEQRYALFRTYPGLASRLPRLPLGSWPTPLEPATRLAAAAGLPFSLLIKRDDLSAALYGGNKVRKLELALARAKARGRRLVVTSGGLGSNHVVATAALGAAVGLETRGLLFCQPVTDHVRRNLLAGVALGADLRWVRDYPGVVVGYLRALMEGLVADGRPPYLLMPGGSDALSGVGYANAAFEILAQTREAGLPDPAALFAPGGTGGTAAGLLAGVALAGLDTTVVAVRVVAPGLLPESKVRDLAAATLRLLARLDPAVERELKTRRILARLARPEAGGLFELEDRFVGEAYGFSTAEGRAAVELARETHGLRLETTYTGKTLAALLSYGSFYGSVGRGSAPAQAPAQLPARVFPAAASRPRPNWLEKATDAGRPVVFVNTYSAADPAGLAVGDRPAELVARVPAPLRWCFDRSRRSCRCGLARQCRRFCAVVHAGNGWEWKDEPGREGTEREGKQDGSEEAGV